VSPRRWNLSRIVLNFFELASQTVPESGNGKSVDQGPRTRKKSILFLDWLLLPSTVTLFFRLSPSFAWLNITTFSSKLTCMLTLLLHFPLKVRPLIIAPLVMIARCSWVMRALNLLDSASSNRRVYIYVAPSFQKYAWWPDIAPL
jgi:hypothetical protein